MRKIVSLILVAAMSLMTFAGCGSGSTSNAASSTDAGGTAAPAASSNEPAPEGTIVFKVAHDSADTVPVSQGLFRFAELVDEKSGGTIKIEVYNNGTLGSASDYVVNCQLGTLDMGVVNQSVVSSFVPDLAAVDIPYIIEGYEHADSVFMGEVGDYYKQEVKDIIGIETLAIWEVGFRNLTNNKQEVNGVADVSGLRIRTMDNPVHQAFWKGLGTDPVPMSWNEAYTAMQQNAIDGQENPLSVILGNH